MASTIVIKARGYHVDVFGHVNHGRYVEFLEEARWAFFDEHPGLVKRLHCRGLTHAVVSLVVDYRHVARVGDELKVVTRVREVGRSSVVMDHEVRCCNGELIVEAKVTNVFVDRKGRPATVTEDFRPLVVEEAHHGAR